MSQHAVPKVITQRVTQRVTTLVRGATLAALTALAACAPPAALPRAVAEPAAAPRVGRFTASSTGEVERATAADTLGGSAWRGDYTASGLARRAPLALSLRDAGGSLAGELALTVVRGADSFDDAAGGSTRTVVRVPLAAVRRDGATLRFETRAFVDPACGCTVTATFTGTLRGDEIAGRFAFAGPATLAAHGGRWRAARVVRAAAPAVAESAKPGPR